MLATRNAGKVAELSALLAPLPLVVVSALGLPGAPEVEEDAPTLKGNALKKAKALYTFTGHWSLADDTGLMVTALAGAPGVHSARFAGLSCIPADNRHKLLRALENTSDRSAVFRTVIALDTGQEVHTFEGTCAGHIARRERGSEGFGYDALFVPARHTRTFAELSRKEKNAISHRGQALRRCLTFLEERLSAR